MRARPSFSAYMMEYTIRLADESDLESLVALRLALQAHLERCNPSLWRLSVEGEAQSGDMFSDLLADENALVLVAQDTESRIIGMITGQVHQQSRYVPEVVGSIGMLYVEQAHRRRGIGKALVARLMEFFTERDAEEITLRYVIGNSEAEGFWSRLGFEPRLITADTSRGALVARLAGSSGPQ